MLKSSWTVFKAPSWHQLGVKKKRDEMFSLPPLKVRDVVGSINYVELLKENMHHDTKAKLVKSLRWVDGASALYDIIRSNLHLIQRKPVNTLINDDESLLRSVKKFRPHQGQSRLAFCNAFAVHEEKVKDNVVVEVRRATRQAPHLH